MKKGLIVGVLAMIFWTTNAHAQVLGEGAVKELLTKAFNKQLPKVLGNGELWNGLDLADLKIRPGYIKVKGKTKWKLKLGKNNKPIRFKGNISTRLKSFGKSDLKVNFPGDRFLFFPKYQRLNDLVDLKGMINKKDKDSSNK